jgi:cysteinyl-tRNA synthetase
MEIHIWNTLSGKLELFKSIKPNEVGLYDCGPTVYDYAHVGNIRAYVFADILRRTLEYAGYTVNQVINITDVGQLTGDGDDGDDKMTKALKREGKPLTLPAMKEVADFYANAFLEDLALLNIKKANTYPKASEHIAEDIEILKKLEKNGFLYKTGDGLYFDTAKFPAYGKLGNINLKGLQSGARVKANAEKRNYTDFNLWKFNEIGWESPWGKGFPGWHIECSAMSVKYLGQPFDIHTGAIDLIPTHHNNEIAQSESADGKPLCNYWMHNAFLNVSTGEKMAKSSGEFFKIQQLIDKGISPLAYRYWLLGAHYRTPIIFSWEALVGAQIALMKLINEFLAFENTDSLPDENCIKQFESFIGDDLNTPKVVALMWDLLKDKSVSESVKKATILEFDKVLGLDLVKLSERIRNVLAEELPEHISVLADLREKARIEKDWQKADAFRIELESLGYTVKDTPTGQKVTKKL